MDANGNLTSPDEFDGVTIRLVSYQPAPDGSASSLGVDLSIVILANPDGGDSHQWIPDSMVCLAMSGLPTPAPPPPQYAQFQVAHTGGGFTLVPDGIDTGLPAFAAQGLTPPAGFYLSGSSGGPLVIAGLNPGVAPGPDQIFNIDFLQGDCWFSLYYTSDQDYFAGVDGVDGWGRPAIAGLGWNNDPTRIWRAEVVTGAAVSGSDTLAAAAPPDPKKARV